MANESEQHQQNQSGESRGPIISTQRGTGPRTSGKQR